MKRNKIFTILTIGMILLTTSGCVSDLNGHSVTINQTSAKPIIIDTYNNDGQKVDQIKTSSIKIKDDNKLDPAIDISYGNNKIIHTSSTLIAYDHLHNYMDDYRQWQTKAHTQDIVANKAKPALTSIYENTPQAFKNQDRNVLIVKSQEGTPIGVFVGQRIKIKQIGSSDFPNSIITIDSHKLFVYDCSYTTYPVSALQAMAKSDKAKNTRNQANVKTEDTMPITNSKK